MKHISKQLETSSAILSKTINVAVVSIGDITTPSTYYRIGQYLPLLKKEGITCTFVSKNDISSLESFDLIINQKALIRPKRFKKPVLFDFDDAIWTRSGRPYSWWTRRRVEARLNRWIERSDCVTVANDYLKSYVEKRGGAVEKIPMALDLNRWYPSSGDKEDLIGWSGHPINLHFLEKIEPELGSLLTKYPHIKLAVHSGEKPKISIPYTYVPYKHGEEQAFIRSLSIGLLPLSEDPYTRGKSPIKALQYLASGVPIVGPTFGATQEIHSEAHGVVVEKGEWFTALSRAIEEPKKMRFLGEQGRDFMVRNHSMESVGMKLVHTIRSCCSK